MPPVATTDVPTHSLGFNFSGREDWQAGLGQHLLPLQCVPADPLGFKARLEVAPLCGSTVAHLQLDAVRMVWRDLDADMVANAPVMLVWQVAGRCRITQGANSTTLGVSTWAVLDAGREFALDCEQGARCLVCLVPQARCPGWLGALDALGGLALPSRGPAYISQSILTSVLRERADFDARSDAALHDSVVELVGHALTAELEGRGLQAVPRQSLVFAQVQAYVLKNLADNSLTVERVATAFGLSRRTLYNLFAPAGVAPHLFIQRAKLERARTLLRDPGWRHAPIARIAAQCGFADPAHFSRAFHAEHGTAPNEWRSKMN